MKRSTGILLGVLLVLSLNVAAFADVAPTSGTQAIEPQLLAPPHYFIAIHNEPYHESVHSSVEESYVVLKKMVEEADSHGIKLTLMLSAPWDDYVTDEDVAAWKAAGHEIAAHHHGVYHQGWDGYSYYPEDEAIAIRKSQGYEPETYLGTLDDMMARLFEIDPGIKSGCMSASQDMHELPDEIVYDTNSGFANFGKPGRELPETHPLKGRNEYVTVGEWNGIQRKWLTHYQAYHDITAAKKAFNGTRPEHVYGVIFHSVEGDELDQFAKFTEFVHFLAARDPLASRSMTVSEIIESGLLEEREVQIEDAPVEPSPV